jgi:hypothetical protein
VKEENTQPILLGTKYLTSKLLLGVCYGLSLFSNALCTDTADYLEKIVTLIKSEEMKPVCAGTHI